VRALRFPHAAQNVTLLDYISTVEYEAQRLVRLEGAIEEAIQTAPAHMKAVIEALQVLRGVAKITAVTLSTEVGTFARFENPRRVMSYTGVVPSERSSGPQDRRGAITKAGNSHLRRVLIEAAWQYRHGPRVTLRQKQLLKKVSPQIGEIAWKAQERLHRRFWRLSTKSKPAGKVVTAVARELVGFIWAIGTQAEAKQALQRAAA
jgi:hypothetical protein